MKRRIFACSIALVLSTVIGCMTGTWTYDSMEPEMARDDYRMFGPTFPGQEFTNVTLRLHDDGTYHGTAYYGEDVQNSTGTWKYRDGKLTLVDRSGGAYTWDADLKKSGQELELERTMEGTDVILTLKRQ
jgi:hypothetical protein